MQEPVKNQVTDQQFIDNVVKRKKSVLSSPPYDPALLWLTPESFHELTTIKPHKEN